MRLPRPAIAFPVLGALLTLFFAPTARANIYTYTDKTGVVHFTNIKPTGKTFKLLYKTGPEKALKPRCATCDLVPARDTNPTRFTRFDRFIQGAARLYKIPIPLVRAVMEVESDYDPRVVSSAGARGLMQLLPETARQMGVTDIFDPRENVYGGVRYLRVLANTFSGNLVLTIAGYHAGPGAVAKYKGIPPYETTQLYVRAVMWRYYRYKKLEASAPIAASPSPAASDKPTPPRAVPE
jgi:hypothetical protein